MSVKITHDENAPTAALELPILQPLPDYEIGKVDMTIPREVDGILVTQGFRDLVDDARGILDELLSGKGLEIVQITGAICPANAIYRPGLWIVLRESNAGAAQAMSGAARAEVAAVAEELRNRLQLS